MVIASCQNHTTQVKNQRNTANKAEIVVLGIAQDAGYPQINCEKECCRAYWNGERKAEKVTSLGLIDRESKKSFLIEATPDIVSQWQALKEHCTDCKIEGILLTHAHIGHYSGLVHLGREAMGAHKIKVFAMPRMVEFLKSNGPWNQLVSLENIVLVTLKGDSQINMSPNISVKASLVPHRDEFSETVGFTFSGPEKSALFIPDIDKWEKWEKDVAKEIAKVNYAFLDGTFYDENELPGRNMSEIPHPFISESIMRFKKLNNQEIAKIWFIHFNHTNQMMIKNSEKRLSAENLGFNFAEQGLTQGI